MRVVLDTNVLWDSGALAALARSSVNVVVPALVFAERARQYRQRGRSTRELREQLARNEFTLEDFRPEHAERYATNIVDDALWRRVSRDALIAGHLGPGDILLTANVKDFLAVGVQRDQLVHPRDIGTRT